MTPEQKKAKEIVEKYLPLANGSINQHIMYLYKQSIGEGKKSFKDLALYSRKYHAKACAIEEVKAVIDVIADLHIIADSEGIMKSMIYHEQLLTEIEKL